jgi:hypothetical protein
VKSRHGHRFTLELRPGRQRGAGGRDTLAGTITDEQGTTIRFDGWLGLASALERQLTDGAHHEHGSVGAQHEPGMTSTNRGRPKR